MENQEQQELTAAAQEKWNAIAPQVEALWGEIFQTANSIIKVHLKFGFTQFADKISPSIEDILLGLKAVESLLDALDGKLEWSEQRMVMNAKQQIWLVQCIGGALKNGDEADYDAAIQKMASQAVT